MRRMKAERQSSKAVKLLNVLAVLMVFVMLISLGRMVGELHRVFNRDPYSGIEYALREGDYAEMIRNYYYRNYDVAPFASTHEEEYHVAQYADAAFQHQFFQAVGDQEMAGRYAARMESARQACGSLAAAAEDVDRLLENIRLYP
ncbi:MAG: hypothetical protein IJ179_00920 [Oscillospiraceae bacterium]|nr:hypothetical protein [Oscillospiraceae bacterium]